MTSERRGHRVYRSLNKPLTIAGVERRLFFLALAMGAAAFNFFASLMSGLVMFVLLYLLARWATATDPEILRLLMNSARYRTQYDPAKREIEGAPRPC